jgi:hypothetical protein
MFSGLREPEGVDREPRAGVAQAVLGREPGQADLHEEDERVLDGALPADDHDQVPILPKVTHIGLQIFVITITHFTFLILFNQYSLVGLFSQLL